MSTKSILLIDDDCDMLLVLGERCRNMGWNVRSAHNLLTALAVVEKQTPDLICIDVRMPTGNGLRFCEMLAGDPDTAHIPIIVLTGQRDAATIQTCDDIKAHYVPKRPDVWTELCPLIEQLLSQPGSDVRQPQHASPPAEGRLGSAPPHEEPARATREMPAASSRTVVIADDEPDVINLLTERFTRLGCRVIGVDNALAAVNVIHRSLPDLACIDVNMPAGNGLSVCEMMTSDERLRHIPTIVLTGSADQDTIRRCHDMMVYYVQKGGDIWSRVEPLARELLGLESPHEEAVHGAGPLPGHRVAAPAAALSADENPARRARRAAAKRPAAAGKPGAAINPVAPVSAATLKTMSPDSSGQSASDNAMLDAVFAMLGCGAADDARRDWPDEQQEGASAEETSTEPPWVLCIDDDVDFSNALKCRLESHGVAVIRAHSGMEGYRLAFTRPASAILLDYSMPNGQGDYILGRLKDNPVTKRVPVIVITGKNDKMLERRMLNMGAERFFTKPIKFELLRDELAKYIDILAESASTAAVR